MAVKVKNLNGTEGKSPSPYSSWLEYWEKKTGQKVDECAACSRKADVGGHVKKVDGSDDNHYIVPLCNSHNGIADDFFVFPGAD